MKKFKRKGVYLPPDFINSDNFAKLTKSEMHIYIVFLSKIWKKPKGVKQSKWEKSGVGIKYPYAEMRADFGYTDRTISRSISNLVDYGYLIITRRGSQQGSESRPTIYEIPKQYI